VDPIQAGRRLTRGWSGSSSSNTGLALMPRLLGIVVGSLMIPVALFIALGGLVFLLDRSTVHRYVGPLMGLVCIFAVGWLLSLSWRLILNRPRRTGGLLSPFALRLLGAVLVLGPLAAAVSGFLFAAAPERWWRIVQACIYFVVGPSSVPAGSCAI
jgi:hypothetical protein